MLKSITDRLPSAPKVRNPFPTDPVGQATYIRMSSLEPEEVEAEFAKLDPAAQDAYNSYAAANGSKQLIYKVTGIAFAGACLAGIAVALSSDDEDEEYDDEDEEEIDFEDEIEDEDDPSAD